MVLNAEERMKKAIIKLQGRQPFFSYLALYLKFQKAKKGDLPDYAGMGVASDGTLIYSEEFVDKLTDEEIIGVLCHEVLHLALIHLLRRRTREMTKWNIGCDLAVNTILKKNRFNLPTGSLGADNNDCFEIVGITGMKKVEHISDKTAEELYDLLPDLKEQYTNGYDGKGNYGFDEHKEGTGTQGEKQKQENEWLKRIEEAYTNSKMRGQHPCGLERYIEELKKSQINWRALLQKYLQALLPSDYTWARRSKKSMATNIYMPNILKEKIDVVVMIDLSGSIGKKEMTEFLSEIIALSKAFSQQIDMRLLTHDTKVHNDYKVSNGSIDKIKKLKLCGGGGTDFQEPLNYIEEKRIKPECLIWLTDGYGDKFKKPKYPIIWILNPNSTDEYIKGTGTIIKLKETY